MIVWKNAEVRGMSSFLFFCMPAIPKRVLCIPYSSLTSSVYLNLIDVERVTYIDACVMISPKKKEKMIDNAIKGVSS